MDLKLKGKIIIVTGGSKGIGYGICERLILEGAIPVIIGRNKETIPKALKELEKLGGKAGVAYAELTDPDQCKLAVDKIIQDYGTIDGLVNNAGIANTKLLHEETYSNLSKIFNTNLLGSMNVSNAIIPNMIKNKSGKIINIASTLGYRPLSYVGAYSATKAALIQVTKSQSIELARFNICVNALAPGYILTDINKEQLEGDAGVLLKKKIPLKRFATAEELDVIISMLLNRHNTYMTGAVIAVDGGLSAGL